MNVNLLTIKEMESYLYSEVDGALRKRMEDEIHRRRHSKMPWGQYAGQRLEETPTKYLKWVLTLSNDDKLRNQIYAVLVGREDRAARDAMHRSVSRRFSRQLGRKGRVVRYGKDGRPDEIDYGLVSPSKSDDSKMP